MLYQRRHPIFTHPPSHLILRVVQFNNSSQVPSSLAPPCRINAIHPTTQLPSTTMKSRVRCCALSELIHRLHLDTRPQPSIAVLLLVSVSSLCFFYTASRQLAACRHPHQQRQVDVPAAAHFQTPAMSKPVHAHFQTPAMSKPVHAHFQTPARKPVHANLSSFGSVCHTPSCIAQYESAYLHSRRIPNLRHILWKSENVSAYFAKQLRTWNATHPDWKYVLWRDTDLEKFVARHYTGALRKFKSLPMNIMRIDMIRYLILHRFGGVYADLDYVLARPLDRFLKFPAVVTRETEAHALFHFGMKTYPPALVGNPAFMMSEPRHPFFEFCILQLAGRAADAYFTFAGPLGLSFFLTSYAEDFQVAHNPEGVVIVPASRNFYGYKDNSLAQTSEGFIVGSMRNSCGAVSKLPSTARSITAYCKDVNNLDPITDRNEPMYAIHDSKKARSSYDPAGSAVFHDNPVDIRTILNNVVMADTIY